jgi:hypothetical protein
MLMHFAFQSDDQSSSNAKPFQQLWTSAACSAVRVAHDLVDRISEATNQDARAISRAGGIVLGCTSGFLLIAIRRSESMFVALDDWILSGEEKKCWPVVFWEVRPALIWPRGLPWCVG